MAGETQTTTPPAPGTAPTAPITPNEPAAAPAPAPATPANLYEPSGGETSSSPAGETQSGEATEGAATGGDTSTSPENKDPAGEPGADAVPVTVADLTLPDGFEASPEVLGNFATLATEAGLSKENAQSLLDLHLAEVKKLDEASGQAWLETVNGWRDEVMKDKDLGGNNFKAVETRIGKALDQYGSPEAREAFNATGAGWHPEIVRFVNKMAEALDEGTAMPPGSPAQRGPVTPGARLYGDSTTK